MAAYRQAEGPSVQPAGLRTWLQANPSEENDRALRLERQLDDVYAALSKAGMSSGEIAASRRFVLQRLTQMPKESVAYSGRVQPKS